MRKLTLAQLEALERTADHALQGLPLRAMDEQTRKALYAAHDKLIEGIERARIHKRNRHAKSQAAADAR